MKRDLGIILIIAWVGSVLLMTAFMVYFVTTLELVK